jgi:hypothetical protein
MDNEIIKASKEYKKAVKSWGEGQVKQFLNKNEVDLERVVIDNNLHIQEVTNKTKSNHAYKEAERIITDFDGALRDKLKDPKLAASLAAKILYERKSAGKLSDKLKEGMKKFEEETGSKVEVLVNP